MPPRSRRSPAIWAAALVVSTVALIVSVFVILAPHPVSSTAWAPVHTIARDYFDRPDQSGWGTPWFGSRWRTTPGSDASIDDDRGRMVVSEGHSVTADIPVFERDVDVAASLSFSPPVGTTSTSASVFSRGGNYAVRLRSDARGTVRMVVMVDGEPASTSGVVAASLPSRQTIAVELRVTGDRDVRIVARARVGDGPVVAREVMASGGIRATNPSPSSIGVSAESTEVSEVRWTKVDAVSVARVAAPPDAAESSRAADDAGAGAAGSRDYRVPAGALIVAPTGRVGASGTATDPFGSIRDALAVAPTGSTIAIRSGVYRESVVIPRDRAIVVQPFRRDRVWLDGSEVITDWTREARTWVHDGWTRRFDASPTYARGMIDGQGAFGFLGPQAPLAAHPEQVWVDGRPLQQVDAAGVGPGTFAVDEARDRLIIGDDPAGREVRASDLTTALTVVGGRSTVQGLGIRRYSPSVPDLGAVRIVGASSTVRHLTIEDSATTGLSVTAADVAVTDVSVARSGMLGVHANNADGLRVDGLRTSANNTERFNRAPVSGGMKVTHSRDLVVRDSVFDDNLGNGLWFDESDHGIVATGNDVVGNTGNGLVLELSASFVVADNVVTGNGRAGIFINDSGHGDIWNNTVASDRRAIDITQSTRRASDLSLPGHDRRRPLPDPTVTWVVEDVDVYNNVLADSTGNCVLAVEDYSHERSGAQMRVRTDGNLYQRGDVGSPVWLIAWSRGPGDPAVYLRLSDYVRSTANGERAVEVDGRPVLLSRTRLAPSLPAVAANFAEPLPARIAELIGQRSGARSVGAFSGPASR